MINKKYAVPISELLDSIAEQMSGKNLAECVTLLEIAETIEKSRKALGLTQETLANKMGITQGMVSRWESGCYNFTIKQLALVSESLGLDLQCPISPYGQDINYTLGDYNIPKNQKTLNNVDKNILLGAA